MCTAMLNSVRNNTEDFLHLEPVLRRKRPFSHLSRLYRYVTRTNVPSLIIRTGIKERNIRARNITI